MKNVHTHHFLVQKLEFGIGSTVHWAKRPPKRLFVFLHGFNGSAEQTWFDISSTLRANDKFKEHDLVFIGYDSTNCRALASARLILQALANLITHPAKVHNTSSYGSFKRKKFLYQKTTIFAHSLGGALVRQIALDMETLQIDTQSDLNLVLFAPAHKGSNALNLANNLLSVNNGKGWRGLLKNLALHRKPILSDLLPQSPFLQDIECKTIKQSKTKPDRLFVCDDIAFGAQENIVEVQDFANDPPFKVIADMDHVEICKTDQHKQTVLQACLRNTL